MFTFVSLLTGHSFYFFLYFFGIFMANVKLVVILSFIRLHHFRYKSYNDFFKFFCSFYLFLFF